MTHRYTDHATDIVDDFVDGLPAEVARLFTDKLKSDLAMTIESAISTAVVEQMERVADSLEQLAQLARKDAEAFDEPPSKLLRPQRESA
jgi:hypothetical protein